MRECKICGIEFNPTKRKNQANCEECIHLSSKEKRTKRKQIAINISHKEKNLPEIDIKKVPLEEKLLHLAHIGNKQINGNIGKGDKRARNNPADISLSDPFAFYLNEVRKTVLMPNNFHHLIDDGHDKNHIKEQSGMTKELFDMFEPIIDYLMMHK